MHPRAPNRHIFRNSFFDDARAAEPPAAAAVVVTPRDRSGRRPYAALDNMPSALTPSPSTKVPALRDAPRPDVSPAAAVGAPLAAKRSKPTLAQL